MLPLRFLLIGLLLVCTSANASKPDRPSEQMCDLGLRLDQPKLLPRGDNEKELENFSLFSSDYPSRLYLRKPTSPSLTEGSEARESPWPAATIERVEFNGQTRSCTFKPFEDEASARHIKLRSLRNGIEIFEVIRLCKESRDSSMELFIFNMTDCRYNRTTLMKGKDYAMYKLTYVEPRPKDTGSFEIFSLDGKDECGSYTCKRTYFIENATMTEPKPFEMLKDESERDWRLIFMAGADDGGYFALIRREASLRLLSLDWEGKLLGTMNDKIDKAVKMLRISTSNNAFGFCYILEEKRMNARCLQLDRKLGISFNRTYEFKDDIEYMATYNLPRSSGLLMMTARCSDKIDNGPCEAYDMRLTKFTKDREPEEIANLKEDACRPKLKREFKLYEEADGQICMFYACDCPDGRGTCDKMLRTKCLGFF